jgi:hypothetical protein
MHHVVAKPFNTATRRYRVGDPLAETDVAPDFDWEHLIAAGFVAPADGEPIAPEAPADAAPAA